MLAAPRAAADAGRRRTYAVRWDEWVSPPKGGPIYGPGMGIETIIMLFAWLAIAEIVLKKLLSDPE